MLIVILAKLWLSKTCLLKVLIAEKLKPKRYLLDWKLNERIVLEQYWKHLKLKTLLLVMILVLSACLSETRSPSFQYHCHDLLKWYLKLLNEKKYGLAFSPFMTSAHFQLANARLDVLIWHSGAESMHLVVFSFFIKVGKSRDDSR